MNQGLTGVRGLLALQDCNMQWGDGLVCDPEIEVEVSVASNGDEFVGVLAVDHLENFTLV